MKYTINYEELFFDRYNLDENEKEDEALYLVQKALNEKEIRYSIDGNTLFIEDLDYITENELEHIQDVLKNEFFIFLDEYEEEKLTFQPDILEEAEKYIRKKYVNEDFSFRILCDMLNVTRKRLDVLFIEKHNITAKTYLKRVRVMKAKEFIKDGEKMEDVAYLCGFGSVKTMQRAFKEVLDRAPGEYRQ